MFDSDKAEKHPSYGMASFSRVNGTTHLFGSEFDHHNFMKFTISRGERHRDLANDWYFEREPLIEIWLSESQFCELITRPNMGGGVPVTLRQVGKDQMPMPPRPDMRARYDADLKKDTEACVADLRAATASLNEAIESGKVGKAVLREIAKKLEYAACAIDRGIPWVHQQFKEAMEGVIGQAKTEIEAHVSAVAMRIGVDAMRLEAVQQAPRLIEAPQEDAPSR